MIQNKNAKLQAIERLLIIMDELRAQCPWDKKQTWQTLRSLTIEELYELTDALIQENRQEVKEELGDVLLHIVFYSKIAEEQYGFDFADVCNSICDKLIARHPHIYADTKVQNEEDVKRNWEKLKMKEGKTSVLQGVPKGLPSIVKAWRIQEKAGKVGFEWENKMQVWQKIEEEIQEFKHEEAHSKPEKMEEEFGDILFAFINYARWLNIDPERALEKTNQKFIRRFQYIEQKAKEQKQPLENYDLNTLDNWWNEAKKNE